METSLRESLESPVLRIGLAGYTAAEEARISDALHATAPALNWRVAALGAADAWCVNGARVQVLPDRTFRIAPGLCSQRAIRVHPGEIGCPVAFSDPPSAVDARWSFDAGSPESIRAMLLKMARELDPIVSRFYMASQIVQNNLDLRHGVYRLSVDGRLLALVSMFDGLAISPLARPSDVRRAAWSHRRSAPDPVPEDFTRIAFAHLMWVYATRTSRDCLPPHYNSNRLYLRRPPRLPLQLLDDETLLLMRELGLAAGTLHELAQRTGLSRPALSRQLGALYMVGAITADPRRAPPPRLALQRGEWNSSFGSPVTMTADAGGDMTVKLALEPALQARYIAT
jgi:hypothetical protein